MKSKTGDLLVKEELFNVFQLNSSNMESSEKLVKIAKDYYSLNSRKKIRNGIIKYVTSKLVEIESEDKINNELLRDLLIPHLKYLKPIDTDINESCCVILNLYIEAVLEQKANNSLRLFDIIEYLPSFYKISVENVKEEYILLIFENLKGNLKKEDYKEIVLNDNELYIKNLINVKDEKFIEFLNEVLNNEIEDVPRSSCQYRSIIASDNEVVKETLFRRLKNYKDNLEIFILLQDIMNNEQYLSESAIVKVIKIALESDIFENEEVVKLIDEKQRRYFTRLNFKYNLEVYSEEWEKFTSDLNNFEKYLDTNKYKIFIENRYTFISFIESENIEIKNKVIHILKSDNPKVILEKYDIAMYSLEYYFENEKAKQFYIEVLNVYIDKKFYLKEEALKIIPLHKYDIEDEKLYAFEGIRKILKDNKKYFLENKCQNDNVEDLKLSLFLLSIDKEIANKIYTYSMKRELHDWVLTNKSHLMSSETIFKLAKNPHSPLLGRHFRKIPQAKEMEYDLLRLDSQNTSYISDSDSYHIVRCIEKYYSNMSIEQIRYSIAALRGEYFFSLLRSAIKASNSPELLDEHALKEINELKKIKRLEKIDQLYFESQKYKNIIKFIKDNKNDEALMRYELKKLKRKSYTVYKLIITLLEEEQIYFNK